MKWPETGLKRKDVANRVRSCLSPTACSRAPNLRRCRSKQSSYYSTSARTFDSGAVAPSTTVTKPAQFPLWRSEAGNQRTRFSRHNRNLRSLDSLSERARADGIYAISSQLVFSQSTSVRASSICPRPIERPTIGRIGILNPKYGLIYPEDRVNGPIFFLIDPKSGLVNTQNISSVNPKSGHLYRSTKGPYQNNEHGGSS